MGCRILYVEGSERIMKIVYGLDAKGESLNGWPFKMKSKKLFLTKEKATQYIPEFTERCCDIKQFECCDRETIRITIIEFELQED